MILQQPSPNDDPIAPVTREQVFTEDMARRVAAMLGFPDAQWPQGMPVPFGWHFPLLGAETHRRALRTDGFTGLGIAMPNLPGNRLVAAGRTVEAAGVLHIGQNIERVSRIKSITPKSAAQGTITIVVVHHVLSDHHSQQPIIIEEQTFILLDAPYAPVPPAEKPAPFPIIRAITPDDAMLFQFSALSFNSHKIHLDREYARDVEHYPDLVINGGLTTLFMTEIARAETRLRIKRIMMRNSAPLFVGRPIQFVKVQMKPQNDTMRIIRAYDDCGRLAAEMEVESDVI
jgi:3-methylfumaryl-CoA hydratase